MVLSNAERQKRFRERRDAMAKAGVTPDMIVAASEIFWNRLDAENPDQNYLSWEARMAELSKMSVAKSRITWREMLPDYDPDDDLAEFGSDADLIRRVSAVVRAVLRPPEATKAAEREE